MSWYSYDNSPIFAASASSNESDRASSPINDITDSPTLASSSPHGDQNSPAPLVILDHRPDGELAQPASEEVAALGQEAAFFHNDQS